jgi:hypothetical protein
MDLAALQAWFQRQMMQLGDRDPSASVAGVIAPSPQRSADERFAVYQNAYVARLLECLQAEFPAVRHAVGEDAFLQFAAAHLERHPPHSYTLGQLGAQFAETLQALRPPRDGDAPDFADFVIETASYERAVSEVFDAEGPEGHPGLASPSPGQPSAMSPERFAQSTLEFFPCVRLLALQFPVHEYVTAVRAGRQTEPPSARPVRLVVHRREYVVRRWEAGAWQFAILECLFAGHAITSALGTVLTDESLPQPADPWAALFEAFQEWSRAELFRSVR